VSLSQPDEQFSARTIHSAPTPVASPRPQKTMDKAARIRRRVLAVFIPLAGIFLLLAEGLNPKGTDVVVQDTATALKVLPIAAAHPTQLFVAGALSLLAVGAVGVSFAALATLVRSRGSAVATVAALVGGIAAFCGIVVNVMVDFNLAAAATAHITQNAAARFLVTTFNSGFFHGFGYVYFIGIPVAFALVAFALWRSRRVPRWLALLYFIAAEVAWQATSLGFLKVFLMMLPFVVATVLLSLYVWRSAAQSTGGDPEPTGAAE
jgi:MFS family permease